MVQARRTAPATKKTVVELLSLKVVAGSEEEAYARAATMLAAATPARPDEVVIDPSDVEDDDEDEDEF